MPAAAMIVPGMRPALPLRMVWLTNICSCTRHSSSPTSSPCFTGLKRLAFESTQHGANVLLAAPRQLEEDLFQRLSILSDHVAELLEAAHGHQTSAVDDRQAGTAGRGAEQPNQHLDGGRLPRSVWAEKSEQLPG